MLKATTALAAKGKPGGLALGNAVGDGNTWCHWLVWSHGGRMVDEKDQVVINSPETIAALEYAKELYKSFVPGTLSWLDPSNNKAFLDGQLSWTINGISIYYTAKNSTDAKIKAMADDISHANSTACPVGRPTELHLTVPAMVFAYTEYPNAAKDYIRFMLEREQYVPWQEASIGYFSQPLRAYEKSPVWTSDPKHTPYRDLMANMLWPGYAGSLGYASAGVIADFVMVNMVAQAASGAKSPKDAAAEAQKRAERYYKLSTRAMAGLLNNRAVLSVLFMLPAASILLLFLTYPLGLGIWLASPTRGSGARASSSAGELRFAVRRRRVLALGVQHAVLHDCRHHREVRARPVAGAAAQPQPAVQGLHPRDRAAALDRADRAVGDRLLVDLRPAVLDHLLPRCRRARPDRHLHRFPRRRPGTRAGR